MSEARHILYEASGGTARLSFNRPERLNALTTESADQAMEALDRAERDDNVRAVLLTGIGRAFGAGFDLGVAADMASPELGRVLQVHFNPLIRRLRASRLPIVAAVNGPCAGASVGIALAADFVLAGRTAFFYLPFVGIGLVPDAGVTAFLSQLAGRVRAAGMIYLGERVGAEEAERWGLVTGVHEDADLMAAAEVVASKLARLPASAVNSCKRLFSAAESRDLDHQLDLERDLQDAAGRTTESREAIRAFMARASAKRDEGGADDSRRPRS